VKYYNYDPWGDVLNTSDDPINNFTFIGRYGGYKDWNTGFVNFQHRWYDSTLGKWISRDPIGVEGGVNLYGYVDANPVNQIDPNGLCPKPQWTPTPEYTHEWKLWDNYSWMSYNKLLLLGIYYCQWIDQFGITKETKVYSHIVSTDQLIINAICISEGMPK